MKKLTLFGLALVAVTMLFVRGKSPAVAKENVVAADTVITYSAEAKAIIDTKCNGCHNPEAKNEKAKKKLMFGEVVKMSRKQQLSALDEILEVLSEGSMPPEKFLQYKPEAKLSESEVATLKAWASSTADNIMGKQK